MSSKRFTLVLGISSGIAGYKILDLIKLLKKSNFDVYVVMTHNATAMFKPSLFAKVSGHRVYSVLIPEGFDYRQSLSKREVEHVKLAGIADLIVIAPATANIIGKLSNGIADDLLSTTILTSKAPILLCPSMNTNMWSNPLVQENLRKLKNLGFHVVDPSSGKLACGTDGIGRLPDIEKIFKEIIGLWRNKKKLQGRKILVTAGGTVEPIDAVRVISNKSSGKMGVAIAQECYFRGASVLLLRSNTSVVTNHPIRQEIFETAADLEKLIKKNIQDYHVLFHVAAVSDFIPDKNAEEKIESAKPLTLSFHPAPKILHMIKSWNPRILLVGFKAVYQKTDKQLIKIGLEKRKQSKSDYIIVNDVGREGVGFSVDTNEVFVISQKGLIAKIEKAPKRQVAKEILDVLF